MMYPNSALIMLSYFDFKIFTTAFLRGDPKKLGGILTTSCRVDIENNCQVIHGIQFMNLWIKFAHFRIHSWNNQKSLIYSLVLK